jgi:predicted RNase H-like nuclease
LATFIGIDLAWKSNRNPSGAAVLHGDRSGAALLDSSPPLRSIDEVRDYIARFETLETTIAIDAPLIIPNATGQRSCERLVGQRYGARHASCHTSHHARYPDALSVQLAAELVARGFEHAPDARGQRVVLEVYPHAALVALFDLPRILKYKKGNVVARCAGLRDLQQCIRSLADLEYPLRSSPPLDRLLAQDPGTLPGASRKDFEDSLDAVVCAYVAYHFSTSGLDGTEMFGSVATGYIANPKLRLRSIAMS